MPPKLALDYQHDKTTGATEMIIDSGHNAKFAQAQLEQTCLSMMETLSLDKQACIDLLHSALLASEYSQRVNSSSSSLPVLTEQESLFISDLFH